MSVYVHLAEGFEEVEALTVVDVLRRASINVKTVSIGADKLVTGAHGICVKADLFFEEANYETCKMIVLPGGMPGTLHLQKHKGLNEAILRFYKKGKWIAAICAAPMILGELDLLNGKLATIYPGMEEHLKGARIMDRRVVHDKNIVTSKGPGTAMEFALKLVELLTNLQMEQNLRKEMVVNFHDCTLI